MPLTSRRRAAKTPNKTPETHATRRSAAATRKVAKVVKRAVAKVVVKRAVAKAKRRTLLPVLRPNFNAREIIKQMALLEDHLNNEDKRCRDCINKHFLTIEGLAEELGSLCAGDARSPDRCDDLPSRVRVLHHAWAQDPKNPTLVLTVSESLRKIRKALMERYSTLPLDKLPSDETAAVQGILKSCGRKKSCVVRRRKLMY
jgi:hypothetical protein